MKYRLLLDEVVEEIFYELESLSEGRCGHECVVSGNTKEQAISLLCHRLKPFFDKHLEKVEDEED